MVKYMTEVGNQLNIKKTLEFNGKTYTYTMLFDGFGGYGGDAPCFTHQLTKDYPEYADDLDEYCYGVDFGDDDELMESIDLLREFEQKL